MGHYFHSFVSKIKSKHKSWSQRERHIAKFDHFRTVGFSLIWTSHKNDNFVHHLHFNVYKIKSKPFLRFFMPWSQRDRHIATILRQFAPNLIIFEPLVSALYTLFFENKHLGHYFHSYVYKIKSKPFLHFQLPWSQHKRHITTIFSWFCQIWSFLDRWFQLNMNST